MGQEIYRRWMAGYCVLTVTVRREQQHSWKTWHSAANHHHLVYFPTDLRIYYFIILVIIYTSLNYLINLQYYCPFVHYELSGIYKYVLSWFPFKN